MFDMDSEPEFLVEALTESVNGQKKYKIRGTLVLSENVIEMDEYTQDKSGNQKFVIIKQF